MSAKKSKKQSPLKLADVARELRRIAADLEKKSFATAAGRITVGEPTFLKARSEFKGDSAYFSLSLKMKLAAASDDTSSPKKAAPATRPVKPRSSGSGEAKKIKKEINRLWKDLRRKIGARETPNPIDSKTLLTLWEEYTLFAEASWSDAWRECKKEIERCLRSAADNEWQEAENSVREIIRLTKECHRQYK